MGGLEARPITRDAANNALWGRGRVSSVRKGYRFALSAYAGERLAGVVVVGNPAFEALRDGATFEVRSIWAEDRRAARFLLERAWKIAMLMGVQRIVSRFSDDGCRAAGWRRIGERWEATA